MITITIDNSYSQVTGLKLDEFNALRKVLSYSTDAQAAYFAGGHPRVKYMIDKKGYFPTGLLSRVKEHFKATNIAIVDKRVKPPLGRPLAMKPGFTPYADQNEALEKALRYSSGVITMPTGTGKSLVIALIAARFNLKTLIVVPNLEIKHQLIRGLKDALTDISKITVENIDAKYLQTSKGYDVLIIDEAHHVAASTYQRLNKTAWKGIYYRLFLTATPFRNNDEETLLFEGIAGSVIHRLSYANAVKRGYIVPVEAYYIESPKQITDAYTWQQVYKELVINNDARNTLLAALIASLQGVGASTLILVKEIAHGALLSELTGVAFANGQDEETRSYIHQFNSGKIKCLIGTEGVLSEGVDTKPCEFVVIAALGKAKSAFMQKVGRAVRTYPGKESAKVILIKDNSHKFTKAHFKAQCKILLDEYGVEAVKLEV